MMTDTDALKQDLTYWAATMTALRQAAAGELRSYEALTLLRYLEWMKRHPPPARGTGETDDHRRMD